MIRSRNHKRKRYTITIQDALKERYGNDWFSYIEEVSFYYSIGTIDNIKSQGLEFIELFNANKNVSGFTKDIEKVLMPLYDAIDCISSNKDNDMLIYYLTVAFMYFENVEKTVRYAH